MKSWAIWLHPTQDMNQPFDQRIQHCICCLSVSHLVAILVIGSVITVRPCSHNFYYSILLYLFYFIISYNDFHFLIYFLLLFKYSFLHFPPTATPCPTNHLRPSILPPFGFVHMSFIHVPWWPFSLFPLLLPPTSPLVTLSVFFISVSLVIFCLLVCFVD